MSGMMPHYSKFQICHNKPCSNRSCVLRRAHSIQSLGTLKGCYTDLSWIPLSYSEWQRFVSFPLEQELPTSDVAEQ